MSTIAKVKKTWDAETVQYEGFKDLGNYVIELPDYDDPAVGLQGLAVHNAILDHGDVSKLGCTAMAKHNSKGEVVFGRNMDLEVSQCPAYVYKTTFGKYSNVCVTYSPGTYLSYDEVKANGKLDDHYFASLIYSATDCINEKGLYVEVNLREANPMLSNYGFHSFHGEETRDDGTPWSELRASTISIPQLVTQNCATVKEAVEFLKNSYDWYTFAFAPDEDSINFEYDDCNMCFLMGDATGDFGLVEIAQDEISFIPYQFGQANFYITPKWSFLDSCGSGGGRLKMVAEIIGDVETLEEAMDAMKAVMWRNETLWIGESVRADDEAHQNPYNQVIFQDDKGNPQLDWRGDCVEDFTILDDGRMVITPQQYEYAELSTYDPKIKEYYDDAIARGSIIIDDGSVTVDVNGEQVSVAALWDNALNPEVNGDDPDKKLAWYNEFRRLKRNTTTFWCHNDKNFEAIKAGTYAKFHLRMDEDENFDPNGMSKYEKLLAYYGYGVEKDEKPLRDDGTVWTTSLNVGVNCAKKEMKVRFWENDEVIYEVKF